MHRNSSRESEEAGTFIKCLKHNTDKCTIIMSHRVLILSSAD